MSRTAAAGAGVEHEPDYTYWAFISYSHADEGWARWLHRSLETYKVPKSIAGTPGSDGHTVRPARLFPMFRDREELSSASSLGERIQSALVASRNLIVICSPSAVGSRWVNEEIRTFKALGREGRVFCLIVDGEPNALDKADSELQECFPEAVRYSVGSDGRITTERTEPLAADARANKDGRRDALLKLSAGILDVGFDSLKQRDQERRFRQSMIAGGILAVAVVVLAGLAYYAFQQKGVAEREARAARAALSGQLASHANASLDTFPQRSLLLSVQALRITEDKREPSVPAAKEALRRALANTGGLTFGGHDSPVVAVALSPDGRWLVTASEDGAAARLWDLKRKDGTTKVLDLRGAGGPVAISSDSRWLVTVGRGEDPARLWDLTLPDPGATARVLDAGTGPVAFSRDNRWLVTGGADRAVRLWDVAAPPGTAPVVLPAQAGRQIVVAISPDSRWLVTSSWNRQIQPPMDVARLWDLTAAHPETTGVELKGHTSSVSDVVFSPDSRWLATSSAEFGTGRVFRSDKNVRLWDLKKTNPAAIELRGHEGPITAMAMSRDSRWLVTGSSDKTARVWSLTDAAIGATSVTLAGHDSAVIGTAIAPHDNASATVITIEEEARDRRDTVNGGPVARTWNIATESTIAPPTIVTHNNRPVFVSRFTSSDDGRRLVLASGSTAFVLDLLAGSPMPAPVVLHAHEGEITTAVFSRDGLSVVTGAADKTARLWRLYPVRPPASPTVIPAGYDARFAVSPDNRWLVTIGADTAPGRSDDVAVLWDLDTLDTAAPRLLRGHTQSISTMAMSRDSRWLATASHDGTARLWDLKSSDPSVAPGVLPGHSGGVSEVAFTPDGHWLVTGGFDSLVRLWDLAKGASGRPSVLNAEGVVYDLTTSTDSRWLAVRGARRASLWDLNGKDPVTAATFLNDGNGQVLLSPDDRWLITYGSDEAQSLAEQLGAARDSRTKSALEQKRKAIVPAAAVLDLTAKVPLSTRRVLDEAGEPLSVSRDGRWLLTQGRKDVPLLWPMTSQGPAPAPIALSKHTKSLDSYAFSADGRWLTTGGYDGSAWLWDLNAKEVGASVRLLSQYPFSVGAVAMRPGAPGILAAGKDLTYLWEGWDAAALPRPITLPVGAAEVSSAVFSTDGKRLVTRSYDTKSVSVWSLELDDLVRRACRTAGRNLTQAEWEQYLPGQAYQPVCPGLTKQ